MHGAHISIVFSREQSSNVYYIDNHETIISGLQVDGSPPSEDFPPSHYDLALFKDVDYYGKKNGKKGLQDQQTSKQNKGGKKRKISDGSPEKTGVAK